MNAKYEIQSKNDFLTGSYLVTKIPEDELDSNALHTIQADCPGFIIPFHYKITDGQVEFVYKIGSQCKLQYFSGDLSPEEYTELWQSLLSPLLECEDWFMNPRSFILDVNYLYYDKNKREVNYMYIPSTGGCCGFDAFYEMAVELSKMITVSDTVLENKVLRAIIKDFNPIDFLQMLNNHVSETKIPIENIHEPQVRVEPETGEPPIQYPEENEMICIQPEINNGQVKTGRESGGYKLFSGRSKRSQSELKYPQEAAAEKSKQNRASWAIPSAGKKTDLINITQSTSVLSNNPGLRYIGHAHLPPSILINISEGEIFTIGRFDATIGKKQSSFEFEKKTKAVSRRHAAIERDVEGYKIVDLSSSAGTFVNDKKLPPNTPYGLETGSRVSFGNSGADYVWEVS